MGILGDLFVRAGREPQAGIDDWVQRAYDWLEEYQEQNHDADLSFVDLRLGVFTFDHSLSRVVLACAISEPQLFRRDAARSRGFPNLNDVVRKTLGCAAFAADKGHFLGHASGGQLDINLFAQRRELNRGWSPEGKRFRAMERFVASNPGCFFYHRPVYDDLTAIPARLAFGVLRPEGEWWEDLFQNR